MKCAHRERYPLTVEGVYYASAHFFFLSGHISKIRQAADDRARFPKTLMFSSLCISITH